MGYLKEKYLNQWNDYLASNPNGDSLYQWMEDNGRSHKYEISMQTYGYANCKSPVETYNLYDQTVMTELS